MTIRRAFLISAVLVAFGCSDDSGSTEQPVELCPAGQERNPVTGACVAPSANNGGGTQDSGSGGQDTNVPDSANNGGGPDMAAPDVVTVPDMRPPPDMKEPDMAPPVVPTRFVAIGDSGTGSATQLQVGQSIGTVCTSLGGCDFGLLLGDNFYDSGVDSVDDTLFMTHFVTPYGHLPFPFYVVLGNHDLGGDGLGLDLDFNKADYQINYSQMNPQWIMPAEYYRFSVGPLFFVGLNTTDIFFERDDDQRTDVPTWLPEAGTKWKIAFGHHPYISNGPHGNAGDYEGTPFIPIVNGANVKDFMESVICGNFDLYLCGHDHSRQDLVDNCNGTEFIVSGAGAKTTDIEGNNPVHFEADTEGFLLIEATDSSLTVRFYDAAGTLEHTRNITR